MSITLYEGETGSEPFHKSVENLRDVGNYKHAMVTRGIWIMYARNDFNVVAEGNHWLESDIKILEATGQKLNIEGFNASMRLLSSDTGALTLFEHPYYGGISKVIN